MKNLINKGKEIFTKIKGQIVKIGIKKVAIVTTVAIVGVATISFLGNGSSEKVVLANVVHPKSKDNYHYTFNEVKSYEKVDISNIKLRHKKNEINNNTSVAGDVEYEFTIKNKSNQTINNIGYMLFLKDLEGKAFVINGVNTIDLKPGEKTKIKVFSIWCGDKNPDCGETQIKYVDNYFNDYATLNVYELVEKDEDGYFLVTKDL